MNILFAGVGYFPFRVCGDKNYFFELLPLLVQLGHKVVVFSINDSEPAISRQDCGDGSIVIYNIKRSLHFNSQKYRLKTEGKLKYYHHKHSLYQEIPEIFATFVFHSRLINQIIVENNIQIINFMDNCGPSMRYLQAVFPSCKVCYSAMNYNKRLAIYDSYLKFSMSKLSRIIPYSEALAEKYSGIGIKKENLTCIPWAVNSKTGSISNQQKNHIRNMYMHSPENYLFLWTGFIQQIGERDLNLTLQLAHKMVKLFKNVEFIFSFKPEFQSVRSRYNSDHERVKILDKVADFKLLLASSDYLLSPVEKLDSILAPPLTWIESMHLGTPIITTAAGGSNEIINDNTTGYIGNNYEELSAIVSKIANSERDNQMRLKATSHVSENYEISNSAIKYSDMYREMMRK